MFLAKRLMGRAGDRGLSSDAMIALAACGYDSIPDGYTGDYPHDTDDLGRCCEAFKLAPWQLRQNMLGILTQWSADLDAKRREKGTRV